MAAWRVGGVDQPPEQLVHDLRSRVKGGESERQVLWLSTFRGGQEGDEADIQVGIVNDGGRGQVVAQRAAKVCAAQATYLRVSSVQYVRGCARKHVPRLSEDMWVSHLESKSALRKHLLVEPAEARRD